MRPTVISRLFLELVLVLALALPTIAGAQASFRRGDATGDGRVDAFDAATITDVLFAGAPVPACLDSADADDDGLLAPADSIFILLYVSGAVSPPDPGPLRCGPDPTPDLLPCLSYSCPFIRGDANGDRVVDPADAAAIFDFLTMGMPLGCLDAADANDDGSVDIADSVLVAGGGPYPPPDAPSEGHDATLDLLDCQVYDLAPLFLRGDSDGDLVVEIEDADAVFDYLFGPAIAPDCLRAADATDDGVVDAADVTYILAFLTLVGPPPPAPFPLAGLDPTSADPCEASASFIRGDANQDGIVDASDEEMISVAVLGIFPSDVCIDAMDADDSGVLDAMDAAALIASLAAGAPPLPPPGPVYPGIDPTADGIGCDEYAIRPPVDFVRGDCNNDDGFDIGDPIAILGVLFPLGPPPTFYCGDACDANDDGGLDIADPIAMLGALFLGLPLPAPYPGCGQDGLRDDPLNCHAQTDEGCP